MTFNRTKRIEGGFNITPTKYQKNFRVDIRSDKEEKRLCLKFAFDTAFGDITKSVKQFGENDERTPSQRLFDTFQGKLAEWGFWNFCRGKGIECKRPDMEIYKGSEILDTVIRVGSTKFSINIKSGKPNAQFLLLEFEKEGWATTFFSLGSALILWNFRGDIWNFISKFNV